MSRQLLNFKFLFLVYLIAKIEVTDAWLGIDFGEDGNNLPSRGDVVQKFVDLGVTHVRIYHTAQETMLAFANRGIELVVGITNEDFPNALSDVSSALNWLNSNVVPYPNSNIKAITVGNEVLTTGAQSQQDILLSSMEHLHSALGQAGLGNIKVTTAHAYNIMDVSYPPSAGTFKAEYVSVISGIADFLSRTGSYVFVNIYPYFTYQGDKVNIQLSYALLGSGQVTDNGNGKTYNSLFAQQLDAVYAALDHIGYGNLLVRVSEIGWPSDGGPDASISNAQAHNQNLVGLTQGSTPLKPANEIDAYLFAMFNENLKPEGIEQHWGLYYPDLTKVYNINF